MKDMGKLSARLKDKKGTVVVVVTLFLVLLFGFAAIAIDVGYMMVRRNELQNIADTAALAATGQLGHIYDGMAYADQLTYTPDLAARHILLAEAQAVASVTGVSGVTISDADLLLGVWSPSAHTFTLAASGPTAVRVTAHKDTVENGAFSTLLAGMLGRGSFNVTAVATASLTPLSKVPESGLPIPVGISQAWYSDPEVYCKQPIKLYPTNDPSSCAGWNVYEDTPASANKLQTIIGGLTKGTYQSPATAAGVDSFNFTGGTDTSAIFNTKNKKGNMIDLFNAMKVLNDGTLDMDNDPNTWTTSVPVYKSDDCSNPNGSILIVGFSTIRITSVTPNPNPTIWAQVVCDNIVPGAGGGGLELPTLGTIPQLVQ